MDIEQTGEAEMDEMGSFVGNKGSPHWLWHAIDHHTGAVLAYGFGRRKNEVFLKLKALIEPFGLTRYDTDHWGAYTRHLEPDVHSPGKRNTQKTERKHLTLRTRMKRLVRKTICCSTSVQMHDIVLGWFVNRYVFGRAVSTWLSPLLEHYPFSYTKETHDVKLGPLELSVKEKQTVNVPIWAGVGAIVAGGGLLLLARKKN